MNGQNPSKFFGIYDVARWDTVWMAQVRSAGDSRSGSCGSISLGGRCSRWHRIGVSLIVFVVLRILPAIRWSPFSAWKATPR